MEATRNCKTVVIAHVSPHLSDAPHSNVSPLNHHQAAYLLTNYTSEYPHLRFTLPSDYSLSNQRLNIFTGRVVKRRIPRLGIQKLDQDRLRKAGALRVWKTNVRTGRSGVYSAMLGISEGWVGRNRQSLD